MKRILKICLLSMLVPLLFSCHKKNSSRPESHLLSELGAIVEPEKGLANSGPYDGPGNGPEGRPLPEMSESSGLLIKIMFLLDSDDPFLAISETQKKTLLPELMEWKEELDFGHDSLSSEYAEAVSRELSQAQSEYRPEPMGPPRGGEAPQGPPPGMDDSGGRLQRPPEPPSDLELLNTILERIS